MLKIRLIPVLYIKNGLIVRSEGFSYHQNIGNIINEAHRYNEWNVDELIYIDISLHKEYDLRRDDLKIKSYSSIEEIVKKISKVCFMPLSFGGGIRTLEDADVRIKNGADKVIINTGAFLNPGLITKIARKYGAQCVVISVDYKLLDNKPIVFVNNGQQNTGLSVYDWVEECEKRHAGEIFLNSIGLDGSAKGYDLETIASVCEATFLPVVACGGAGDFYDFVKVAKTARVSAIAAGNLFHFTERSYPKAKAILKKEGIDVR